MDLVQISKNAPDIEAVNKALGRRLAAGGLAGTLALSGIGGATALAKPTVARGLKDTVSYSLHGAGKVSPVGARLPSGLNAPVPSVATPPGSGWTPAMTKEQWIRAGRPTKSNPDGTAAYVKVDRPDPGGQRIYANLSPTGTRFVRTPAGSGM